MIFIEPRHVARPETMMRFLLLYKIEVTDRYPVTTAVCGSCVTYALAACLHAMGWL